MATDDDEYLLRFVSQCPFSFHITAYGLVILSPSMEGLAWVAKGLGVARVRRTGRRTQRKWQITEKPLAQMPMPRRAPVKRVRGRAIST